MFYAEPIRDEFLAYELTASVESTFSHEYVEMGIKVEILGERMQHNNSASGQPSISALV